MFSELCTPYCHSMLLTIALETQNYDQDTDTGHQTVNLFPGAAGPVPADGGGPPESPCCSRAGRSSRSRTRGKQEEGLVWPGEAGEAGCHSSLAEGAQCPGTGESHHSCGHSSQYNFQVNPCNMPLWFPCLEDPCTNLVAKHMPWNIIKFEPVFW